MPTHKDLPTEPDPLAPREIVTPLARVPRPPATVGDLLEAAYRRAYRAGYIAGSCDCADALAAMAPEAAHERCWSHWFFALRHWAAGDCTRIIPPPHLPRRSVTK